MLLISIALGVIVCLLAIDQIRLRRLSDRLKHAEKEIGSWKLATEHLQRELEKHW